MLEHKSQGETVRIFTLIISEIATRKVKISAGRKICDISDISQDSGVDAITD
jgi:hypothetical protein